jgi:hypothetical protein
MDRLANGFDPAPDLFEFRFLAVYAGRLRLKGRQCEAQQEQAGEPCFSEAIHALAVVPCADCQRHVVAALAAILCGHFSKARAGSHRMEKLLKRSLTLCGAFIIQRHM